MYMIFFNRRSRWYSEIFELNLRIKFLMALRYVSVFELKSHTKYQQAVSRSANICIYIYIHTHVHKSIFEKKIDKSLSETSLRYVYVMCIQLIMLHVHCFAIQVLKFYAWEPAFESRILQLREKELQLIRRGSVAYGFNQVISVSSANIVS